MSVPVQPGKCLAVAAANERRNTCAVARSASDGAQAMTGAVVDLTCGMSARS